MKSPQINENKLPDGKNGSGPALRKKLISFPWIRRTGVRCGWLYLLIAGLLWVTVDRHQAFLNRMNVMKDVEYDLELFLKEGRPLTEDALRWGVRYYRSLQKYAPDNSLYFGNLGFCYFYLGRYEEAIRAYQKAVELEPKLYTYHYDLGLIYSRLGRTEEALDNFLDALNTIRHSVQYFMKTGEALQNAGQDLSFVVMKVIKQSQDDEEDLLLRLGDLFSRSRDYEKAAALLAQGLKTQAASAPLFFKAGWIDYMTGQDSAAVQRLTRAIELDPSFAVAYYYRGLSLRRLGQAQAGDRDLAVAKRFVDRGQPGPDAAPQRDKLHLNIELRILRQQLSYS